MNNENKTIMLINSPSFNKLVFEGGNINTKASDIQSLPPINLVYLATYLKSQRPEINVIIKDFLVETYSKEEFISLLELEKPFIIGITIFSTELYDAFNIAKQIKEHDQNIILIGGGPHTALYPKETLEQPFFDMVCQGEGEKALVDIVDHVINGREIKGIDNIWYKKDNEVIPPERAFINAFDDLDEAPILDQGFVNHRNYYQPFLHSGKGLIAVLAGRGCPFKCTYCNSSSRIPRQRSIEHIIKEIISLVEKFNCNNVFLLDDTFNIKSSRVIEFSKQILDKNIKITWSFRGRVNSLNEETIEIAKKAGLKHIALGVEDFTDEGLKKVKKGLTVKKTREIFKLCKKYNIKTTANFIIGLPHNQEIEKQMRVFNFIIELSPTTIQTNVLMLIPGCEIYDDAVREGVISGNEWINHVKNPSIDFEIPGWEGGLTISEQFEINTIINKAFYSRPVYLIKMFLEIRSIREFLIKIKTGFRLLKGYYN